MSLMKLLVVISLLAMTAWCSREGGYMQMPKWGLDSARLQSRNQTSSYIVAKGDSLLVISVRVGIDYQTLASWNGLQPPYLLKEGQVLRLKPLSDSVRVGPAAEAAKTRRSADSKQSLVPLKSFQPLKPDWLWPVKGRIVRAFDNDLNKGVDIAVNAGQTVVAVAAGKVVYSGDSILGYGNLLIIKHDEIYLTAYGNNRRLLVRQGDSVAKGQPIAEAEDRHPSSVIHFEIRKNGDPVNPQGYLPVP